MWWIGEKKLYKIFKQLIDEKVERGSAESLMIHARI